MTDTSAPGAAAQGHQQGAAGSSQGGQAPTAAAGGQDVAAEVEALRSSVEKLTRANQEISAERSQLKQWRAEREAADLDAAKKGGNLEAVLKAQEAKLAELEPLAQLGLQAKQEREKQAAEAAQQLDALAKMLDSDKRALVAKIGDPIVALSVAKELSGKQSTAVGPGFPTASTTAHNPYHAANQSEAQAIARSMSFEELERAYKANRGKR